MAHIGSIGTQTRAASAFINALVTMTATTGKRSAYAAFNAFSAPSWWNAPPPARINTLSIREQLAWWQVLASDFHRVSRAGFIAGIAKQDGLPLPGATIRLYYEPTGVMIEQQRASASGSFHFDRLDPNANDFQIIAQHETLNAQIFAHLTPAKD